LAKNIFVATLAKENIFLARGYYGAGISALVRVSTNHPLGIDDFGFLNDLYTVFDGE
jgi:hypothetical protein